jgi:hypothetical protein
MELREYSNFATEKINWLERRFSPIIQKKLNTTMSQKRVQELWRDIKILERKLEIARQNKEEEVSEEIETHYNYLTNNAIPNFLSWMELINGKIE